MKVMMLQAMYFWTLACTRGRVAAHICWDRLPHYTYAGTNGSIPADDLLHKGAAHDWLDGWLLVGADQVLVNTVLQGRNRTHSQHMLD
jgi:hypothetical protein